MTENQIFWQILMLAATIIAPSTTVWILGKHILLSYFSTQNQKNNSVKDKIEIIEERLTILESKQVELERLNIANFDEISQSLIDIKKAYKFTNERIEETHILFEKMNDNFITVIEMLKNKKI